MEYKLALVLNNIFFYSKHWKFAVVTIAYRVIALFYCSHYYTSGHIFVEQSARCIFIQVPMYYTSLLDKSQDAPEVGGKTMKLHSGAGAVRYYVFLVFILKVMMSFALFGMLLEKRCTMPGVHLITFSIKAFSQAQHLFSCTHDNHVIPLGNWSKQAWLFELARQTRNTKAVHNKYFLGTQKMYLTPDCTFGISVCFIFIRAIIVRTFCKKHVETERHHCCMPLWRSIKYVPCF